MADKNDLSAYKPKSGNVRALASVKVAKPAKRTKPSKPAKERRSYKTLLSLTEAEGKAVEEKAGMVPVATWLVAELRKAGAFD